MGAVSWRRSYAMLLKMNRIVALILLNAWWLEAGSSNLPGISAFVLSA